MGQFPKGLRSQFFIKFPHVLLKKDTSIFGIWLNQKVAQPAAQCKPKNVTSLRRDTDLKVTNSVRKNRIRSSVYRKPVC